MRRTVFGVASSLVAALVVSIASAQPPKGHSDRGFGFGGGPEFDRPPLASSDREKQAMSVLDEMSKGKWYLKVTTREGRVLRQLTEAVGVR